MTTIQRYFGLSSTTVVIVAPHDLSQYFYFLSRKLVKINLRCGMMIKELIYGKRIPKNFIHHIQTNTHAQLRVPQGFGFRTPLSLVSF